MGRDELIFAPYLVEDLLCVSKSVVFGPVEICFGKEENGKAQFFEHHEFGK